MRDDAILFGSPTANWALMVALVSVAMAGASLIVYWRTYRRGAPRVRVRIALMRLIAPGHPEATEDVISVEASNRGHVGIEVRQIGWRVPGRSTPGAVAVDPPRGDALPVSVAGLHGRQWLYPVLTVQNALGDAAKVRVEVYLANGRRVRSNWIHASKVRG